MAKPNTTNDPYISDSTSWKVFHDYLDAKINEIIDWADSDVRYTHPATHTPSIIAQDASNRFVTDAQIAAWNAKSNFSGDYADLTGKPTLFSGSYNDLTDKPTIPPEYTHPATHPPSIIAEDTDNRFVTDVQITTWDAKSDFSGAYADLTGKPTLFSGSYNDLIDKPTIPSTAAEVGAEPAFSKNNAFNKNFGVAAGDVCQGNDSRLSDDRNPTSHNHPMSEITDIGSIAGYDFWSGTQAEYDALGTYDNNTLYFVD